MQNMQSLASISAMDNMIRLSPFLSGLLLHETTMFGECGARTGEFWCFAGSLSRLFSSESLENLTGSLSQSFH